MKQFDLIIKGTVVMTSSWIHCVQGAYTWLKEKKINPENYVKYARLNDDYLAFAYYDSTGELIQIVVREH